MKEIILDGIRWRSTGIRNYYVSGNGDVANFKFKSDTYICKRNLKFDVSGNGYCRVPLKYEPNKERKYLVHRLVFEAFVGDLREDMVIDHIDANPQNNCYTNLRQVTQKQNIENAIKHGNFGRNHCRYIVVYDKQNNTTTKYNSIRDFLAYLGIGQYESLNALNKYKEYKNRFEIVKQG